MLNVNCHTEAGSQEGRQYAHDARAITCVLDVKNRYDPQGQHSFRGLLARFIPTIRVGNGAKEVVVDSEAVDRGMGTRTLMSSVLRRA